MVRVLVNWWAYTWGGLYSEVCCIITKFQSFGMIEHGGSYTWMTSFIIQVYYSINVARGSYTWFDPREFPNLKHLRPQMINIIWHIHNQSRSPILQWDRKIVEVWSQGRGETVKFNFKSDFFRMLREILKKNYWNTKKKLSTIPANGSCKMCRWKVISVCLKLISSGSKKGWYNRGDVAMIEADVIR